jgi:hypothetical protein
MCSTHLTFMAMMMMMMMTIIIIIARCTECAKLCYVILSLSCFFSKDAKYEVNIAQYGFR